MSNELEPKPTPSQTVIYQIRIKGHLGSQWTDWFEGLTITLEEDGDTLLTGPVVDQAALHGLLKKVRDLGTPFMLLKFTMGVACAGIGLALYPILRKYNEGLAIGSVGFRIIEGVIDIVGALGLVALLALSQEFVKAGAPVSSYFQTADVLINTGTGWGQVGIALVIIGALLIVFHLIPGFGTVQMVLNLPIFLQEMVWAVWLIAKGVNPSAVASGAAKTATNELLSAA